jgi:hypothetical protein
VEVAVQVANRFIIARLRNRRFFSLSTLNAVIAELVGQINNRRSRRREPPRALRDLQRSALNPLPVEPYVFAEWKECRVGLNYHFEIAKHYYSVPHQCCGRRFGRGTYGRGLLPRQAYRRACALILQLQAYDGAGGRDRAREAERKAALDAGRLPNLDRSLPGSARPRNELDVAFRLTPLPL